MRISKLLFTNTPMDEIDFESASIFDAIEDPQICHICSCNFSLLNTKYPCEVCRLPVCVKDSCYYNQKKRICDQCQHEILVEEVWKEKVAFKDQIIRNMQEIFKENETKSHLIQSQSCKIESLRQETASFSQKSSLELETLETSSSELEKVNNEVQKNIENISMEAQSKQNFESLMVEKLAKSQEHLRMLKIEIEEIQIENIKLEKQIKEASSPLTDSELSSIYNEVCIFCKPQVNSASPVLTTKVCNCCIS